MPETSAGNGPVIQRAAVAESDRAVRWSPLTDPRVLDGALVLTCLGLTWLAAKTPWSPLPTPIVMSVGAVGSLAQWIRRRHPRLASVLGAASLGLAGNPGPWLIGTYSGAAFAARRHVWAAALAGLVGCLTFLWFDVGRLRTDDLLFGAAATALVVAIGMFAATRRALVVTLRQRAEDAESEQSLRDERARAAERTRIAREMHDVLAHKVSLIALHAGALELHAAGLEETAGDTTRPAAGRVRHGAALIRVTAREALQELRTVLGVLHTEQASGAAGEPFADLAALIGESVRAGQPVELRDDAGPLPPATARVIYRVAQEGLTNAHRYAPDAKTTVSVSRREDGSVAVSVRNLPASGRPTDLPGAGSGLVGLAERIRLVGGVMRSGPLGPGGSDGWELHAVVPWLHQHAEDPHPAGTGSGPSRPTNALPDHNPPAMGTAPDPATPDPAAAMKSGSTPEAPR